MKNISELDRNNCTGCRMCEQICPVKAINMIKNDEGFIEPKIDKEKCIDCGLCFKRCPQLNDVKNNRLDDVRVYAAKNKNVEEQKKSSSGGIFSILANYVLENKGTVYGCAFNSNLVAEHIGIKSKEELYKLRGSKYVQSDTKHSFTETKKDLDDNKLVLYSGTPCQIAGLKAFLNKDYDNLITVDLVCHGVPSPKLFEKYIKYLEEKYNSKILNYEFRSKEKNGWGLTSKVLLENGKIKYINANLDPYYKTFLNSYTYREVCYNCKYATSDRVSDITLADYWGIQKQIPEFYDEQGISAIILNTKKGYDFFKVLNQNVIMQESDLNSVKKENHNLEYPSKREKIREKAYVNIENKKFSIYVKQDLNYRKELKDQIKNLIPSDIKKFIKNKLK